MSAPTRKRMPTRAMILAAGLGLRMRPLTDKIPKAMIKVLGKPLIGHLLDHLGAIGVKTIVVNVHYQPDPLIAYLEAHPLAKKIIISDERETILETGGGVKAALSHFAGDPFFVANCDAFFPAMGKNPFQTLAEAWDKAPMQALLLLKDQNGAFGYGGAGDFFMGSGGALERRGKEPWAPFVFTGLQVLCPALFDAVEEEIFSLNEIYDRALKEGGLLGIPQIGPWFHIGTPGTLAEVEAGATP